MFTRQNYSATKKWRENVIVIVIHENPPNVMSSSDTKTKNLSAVHATEENYDTDER